MLLLLVLLLSFLEHDVTPASTKLRLWGILKEGKVTFIRLPRAAFIVD